MEVEMGLEVRDQTNQHIHMLIRGEHLLCQRIKVHTGVQAARSVQRVNEKDGRKKAI